MYWRRNLTRLELALYVAIVGAAIGLFLDRMLDAMELAERTAMEVTLSRLNAAVNMRLALERFSPGVAAHRVDLSRNPFEAARLTVRNFHGELDAPQLEGLERGFWVYDRTRRELIYLPRLRRSLDIAGGQSVLRFRWEMQANRAHMLAPTYKYSWD